MRRDLQGGKCRCKVQGAVMGRAAWDQHGRHLASGCAWGNWRKKRHNDAVKVIVEWIKASGNRAHENTVGAYPPRGVTRTDGTNRQRLTESVATPDIASTDTRGQPTVYDLVITGVRAKDKFRGAAARNAEIKKHKHYDSHKQACREAGSTDRRLDTEMIPLAIETLGTAGEELQELGKALKRSFETTVLPIDDCSAAADFHNTWVYRLSTTVQRGTAEIIYNVVQGNRAPLSAIRIAKDGQIVEAVARDCRHKGDSGAPKRATRTSKTKTASGDDSSGNAAVAQEPTARRSSRIANSRSRVADTADLCVLFLCFHVD